MPGDYLDSIQEGKGEVNFDRERWERLYGLDAPLYVQYGRWLGMAPQADGNFKGIFQGDFGNSWKFKGTSVVSLMGRAWPVTLQLGIMGLLIAQLIALPIGIYSALRQDTWGDYVARSFAILLISVPSFWVGTLMVLMPAIWWGRMVPIMHIPFVEDPLGNIKMFILPSIAMGMYMCGISMRMTRSMMLEVLRQDYIRTGWAKGLQERVIVIRHALKNALIPVVTIIGLQMTVFIGGTVIIEQIFSLHGMGRLVLDALTVRDEPIVSGVVLILGVALALLNLVIDLTYAFLDPRVRYK
jgi:peptide/nickel transport system permease protein